MAELTLHCIVCQDHIEIWAPHEKLGLHFECKKCGAFNYLAYNGNVVIGRVPYAHYWFSDKNEYSDGTDEE